MTKANPVRHSETIQEQLRANRERPTDLENRRAQLDAEIEAARTRLGKAMATGDETALLEARNALRIAEDEREGADRGLAYLADETERLEAELTAARAEEAAAERDARVAAAIAAVDELADSIETWLKTFLPLADRATELTQAANEAEREAAARAGERVPSTGGAVKGGWVQHPGLETVTAALRRYGAGGSR